MSGSQTVAWVAAAAAIYFGTLLYRRLTDDRLHHSKTCMQRPASSQHPPKAVELRNFTPRELAEFDGRRNRKIYLAVRGNVYDVSPGESFYGPNGPYGNFAGRDASRGLATDSFDEDTLTPLDQPVDKLQGLGRDELEALDGWAGFFAGKYTLVGFLVDTNHNKE